ncbi:MAG: beta-galactosidase, partial [Chthoniobacterales bacterium]
MADKTIAQPETWIVEKLADASEGSILGVKAGGSTESYPIPVVIPHAGTYHVWVRYQHTQGKFTSFYVLFRNNLKQAVDFHNIDFKPIVGSAKPEPSPTPEAPKDAKPELVWSSFDITFETPMDATLSFGPSYGLVNGKLGVDCIIITDDKSFDPAKADLTKIAADPGLKQPQTPPAGMQPAPLVVSNSSFFAGESNPDNRFLFAFINQFATYHNYAWEVQMGANYDHGWFNGSTEFGISNSVGAPYGYIDRELTKSTPSPTGRAVNAEGKVSAGFSLSYEPYRKFYLEKMASDLQNFKDDKSAINARIIQEYSGSFDYSNSAKTAFHQWLTKRFTTIDKLNVLWNSHYKNFDDIPLPQAPKSTDNKALWFAFREFSGLEYTNFIAEKSRVLHESKDRHWPADSQASDLSVLAPTFTTEAPMDFEDLITTSFANERDFGVDAYSSADYFVGCDFDYLLSFTKGKRLFNNEFNVHSQDPRNMSQAYWTMIGKGVKGISTYQFQVTPNNWLYYMWGLLNSEDTPRDKLGVIADANQEVHRLERILGPSQAQNFVKPVALYYSRLDLSLSQTTLGIYSGPIDSPYRIYAILRGLGYPVRWITPRQITAGELKNVGSVVMLGANHVPGDAAKTLAQWVKDGGSIVGDQWPGGFDEYDRTQTTLMDVFGIRPDDASPKMDKAAAKNAFIETTTPVAGGIDPEVLRSLNGDDLLKNVEEMWDQYDSTHPVAKAVGNWHVSGFELKKAKVISGEIIGMSMGTHGNPGILLNDYGKGHAFYSAIMLGTLYEAGPIAFEWDTSREGPGVPHLLGAFLHFCGLEPFSQIGLPERMAWKMRVEIPQVDPKGNIFIGITSQNDAPLNPFPLTLRWPV